MLKFMDGFDQFNGSTLVSDAMKSAGYTLSGAEPVIGPGRKTGTRCVNYTGTIGRIFSSSAQLVVLGFAYCAQKKRDDILAIKDVLTLSWPDAVAIGNTKGVAIPLVNLWYYYEIAIDKAAKEIRVYINNELDLTAALPSTADFMQDYEVTWTGTATDTKMLDDLVFLDSAAGKYVDRVGPVQLSLRLPRSDVIGEFSPATGTDHFPMVNKVPPTDAAYIQSNVSGAVDTFRSNDPAADGALLAIGMVVRARKSDIDGRQFGMLVGDAKGVNKEVIQTTMDVKPTFNYAVFETAPSGAAWNTDNMQTTPFGVKVRP